ncbi:recombinase family protein [Apilactobacillus waqarii]|uniref:recombinase family protein n=1 Tax=Apilactobacillus waqarii TaxID=2851006 RepID=UPI0033651E60
MMQYGYARVSTLGQYLDSQVQDIIDAGVLEQNIYTDKYTGTSTDRVGFQKLLKILEPADTLVVTKLDRLARNTREALNVLNELQDKNIKINILNLGIIDNSSIGKFTTTVLLAVAEMERDMIVNRTQEGKKYAKKHNPNYREGRRTRLTGKNKDKYPAIYEYKQSHTAEETAKAFGISVRTVFYIQTIFKKKK